MDISKLKLRNDNVLVKIEPQPEGLIKVLDKELRKQTLGTVIAAGDGRCTPLGFRRDIGVKPGEKILFDRRYADEVSLENADHFLIKEKNIVCVVED